MIKLRVVGSSDDFDQLILSNKPRGKRGSHAIPIDDKLLKILQDAVYGRRDAAQGRRVERRTSKVEPKIPLREIQRRLRAGTAIDQVAQAAGVPVSYVEQFYPPVLYERAGVILDAQALHQHKQRLGASGLPLGDAVAVNLGSRHVRTPGPESWTATRREGEPWVITLAFPFRGRSRTARWRYEPRTRELTPANKLATDVGWVAAGAAPAPRGRRVVPAPPEKPAKKSTARKTTARKTTARKTTARKTTAKRASKRRAPARKTPRKSTARKTTARKTTAKRASKRRAPARKTPRKTTARKTTAKRASKRRAPARKTPRKSTARRATKRTASRRRR